ncbi:hypothetical protein SJY04_05705 [Aeromonas dhakensis]|uniref:hypothetical protein n=1 Tax=Aeromonas dhakensis TaxID=196024 RepID=UPI0029D8724C|nr:hypothetical protein [Aeromonas dhakensis]MDX7740615.1 hypothetical protein [Aeromonas dhakensis]
MLLTLGELEKSQDTTYQNLEEGFFVFPEGENSEERFQLRMQSQLRINDIVMSHRYAMAVYDSNKQQYDPIYEEFNEHYLNMFDDVSEENKHLARMAFQNYNWKVEQEQVKSIAGESLVINLWATVEQFSNRILALTDTQDKSSHRWHDIEKNFLALGLDLKKVDSYAAVNEMRVLNNKIKHLYLVDSQLAKFESFKEFKGKSLDLVPFDLQRYVSSTYHFIFTLTNNIGETVYYPK